MGYGILDCQQKSDSKQVGLKRNNKTEEQTGRKFQ